MSGADVCASARWPMGQRLAMATRADAEAGADMLCLSMNGHWLAKERREEVMTELAIVHTLGDGRRKNEAESEKGR